MTRISCRTLPRFALGALLCGLLATQAVGQDEPQNQQGAIISYRKAEALHVVIELGTGMATILGDVEVLWNDRRIRCDGLIIWFSSESTQGIESSRGYRLFPRRVRELYAEGTVIYSRSEADENIRCDRFYLDLTRDRGLVIDAEASLVAAPQGKPVEVRLRASELRLLGRQRMEAVQARLSPSPFTKPGLEVSSDHVVVLNEPSPEGPTRRLELRGNEGRIEGFPILWVPDFAVDASAAEPVFFVQDFRFGSSSEFGFAPGITVGASLGSADDWITFRPTLDVDYFSKRGFGIGPNLEYFSEDFKGHFHLRYQRDDGSDRAFGDPTTRDRGRGSLYHRHRLPGDAILDLEAHLFSDRAYYPTFLEQLDKTEKPPETLAHIRKAWDRHRLSLLFSHRLNDFYSRTEARPELRYDVVSQSLGQIDDQELQLNTTARLGNMRRRFDSALGLPTRTALRADIDNLIETSFALGPVRLRPFVGLRTSWFEEDLAGRDARGRVGFTYGATLSTDLSRDFEASGGLFELDGLRHRILPEVTFRQTLGVNPESESLIAFDDVEAFDNEQVVAFRVRNLLLTKRVLKGITVPDTILDLDIEQRLNFQGTPRDDGDFWAPLDVDLLVRLGPTVDFVSDFELDWDSGFDVFNAAVGWIPHDGFQIFTGYRHFEDSYDAWFVQTRFEVDDKWTVHARTAYEFEESRALDHRLTLSRVGAEWVTQLVVGYDGGEDDLFFNVSLAPLLFWDPQDRSPVLRREPRLGPIRDNRYR